MPGYFCSPLTALLQKEGTAEAQKKPQMLGEVGPQQKLLLLGNKLRDSQALPHLTNMPKSLQQKYSLRWWGLHVRVCMF